MSAPRTKGVPEPSLGCTGSDSNGAEGDLLATETLADLYASQGFTDRAAAIYQRLLDEEPSRGEIRVKLTALCDKQGAMTSGVPIRMGREQMLIHELER